MAGRRRGAKPLLLGRPSRGAESGYTGNGSRVGRWRTGHARNEEPGGANNPRRESSSHPFDQAGEKVSPEPWTQLAARTFPTYRLLELRGTGPPLQRVLKAAGALLLSLRRCGDHREGLPGLRRGIESGGSSRVGPRDSESRRAARLAPAVHARACTSLKLGDPTPEEPTATFPPGPSPVAHFFFFG